ncbi:calmodulin-A [Drosophila sulfurigaster albostrigata]|uniref:calmodulin-A n=1 Tax=Drosophila sulfurigaster albostrigata TaxID=89887 RepID=UPI002D21B35B|nr:calmodulin-A [Drosophila sulfurigaster albostrigata]
MQHLISMNEAPVELVNELRDVFDKYDVNGDGLMSFNELRLMTRAVGIEPTEAELHDLIRTVDLDQNCVITFSEFLTFIVPRVLDIESEENLLQAFQMFNRTGYGFFDAHDLRIVMANFGEHLSKEESILLLSDMDTKNWQHINLEQFLNYLKPPVRSTEFH